mgnify:FL=1
MLGGIHDIQMILTFLLRRRSAIKVLGSVIDAAQRRGHTCFLCTEHEEAKEPFVPGDFARWPKLAASRTHGQMYGTVIGLATDPLAAVGVSSWTDNTLRPYHSGSIVQCYLSEWHRALHQFTQPADAKIIAQQPIVGWTLADHRTLLPPALTVASVLSNGYEERARHYRAGYDLLFTMKRQVPEPWRRSLRGRLWYAKKIMSAQRVAKEIGLPLVIKTRRKHGDPWWLACVGRVIEEGSMYPSTSLQLLAGAHAAHHFMSGAHAEARMMDVPVTNYPVPQPHLDRLPGVQRVYQEMILQDTPNHANYMAKFFTYDDCQAGERVMDVAERL